jgi:hypothetical protein
MPGDTCSRRRRMTTTPTRSSDIRKAGGVRSLEGELGLQRELAQRGRIRGSRSRAEFDRRCARREQHGDRHGEHSTCSAPSAPSFFGSSSGSPRGFAVMRPGHRPRMQIPPRRPAILLQAASRCRPRGTSFDLGAALDDQFARLRERAVEPRLPTAAPMRRRPRPRYCNPVAPVGTRARGMSGVSRMTRLSPSLRSVFLARDASRPPVAEVLRADTPASALRLLPGNGLDGYQERERWRARASRHRGPSTTSAPSTTPCSQRSAAPPLTEGRHVRWCDADRMQHQNVRQLALIAQPVHGRCANAEPFSHLANREQRWLHSSVW